jgi:hypothetical protein
MSWRSAALALLLSLPAATLEAQTLAGSFEQLQVLVKPGDTISVTDSTGRDVQGKVISVSPSSLALLTAGARRDLSEREVKTILQRRPDPLANGTKWGLAIGAGVGFAAAIALASGDGHAYAPMMIGATLIYGGLGAGVGAGLDALVQGNQVIYFKPASSARVTVSPLVTSDRKGVFLSLGF